MTTYDLTTLRLQLLANGYSPTPNLDKRCVLKGWASPEFVDRLLLPETVPAWAKDHRGFKATGMLVRDGLMPIDLDIRDEVMIDAMLEVLKGISPGAYDAPWRTGSPPKLMVLTRWQRSTAYPDPFVRIASDKFIDGAGVGHQIEIFGGALTKSGHTSKQVGAFGPHSYEEDEAGKINFRKIKHEYSYADDVSPLTVPLADLPAMTQEQGWALLKAFEEAAIARGWIRKIQATNKAAGSFVYDITDATRFDVENGPEGVTYAELCTLDDTHLRVSGSFIDGSSRRRDKCMVSWCNARQAVGVWDTEDGVWHLPVEAAPAQAADHSAALQEALAKLQEERPDAPPSAAPARPADSATLAEKAHWLLQCYAYCPPSHSVVDLYQVGAACEMRVQAFQTKYLSWREETEGPRGGRQVALASAAWLISNDRPTIRGVRMRPDRPFPLYEDDGQTYKNTYLAPIHVGTGEADTFLEFIAHLLPLEEERTWFLDWLAHKYRFPGIPGVAIVMVAANDDGPVYGAGRGMLRDILARLMGPPYVRAIDFDVFSGRSAQGVYTDWAAHATLVTVSESKDTVDSGRWTAQRAVYERLKEIVDPRAVERTFTVKGAPAFVAQSFASYLIFSNNRDALQIPAGDRRVTALSNGAQLPPAQAAALQNWMGHPGNITALARALEQRDIEGFDMYAPLRTATKDVMQELARSELDDAYDAVRRRIGPSRLFTGEQVRMAVLAELGDSMGSENIKHQVNRKIRNDAVRLAAQMPPSTGRHWVLSWRSSAGQAESLTTAEAQRSVQSTAKVLFDTSSSVSAWPGAGPSSPEKA